MKYRNKISTIDETNQIAVGAFNIAEISQPLAEISQPLVESSACSSVVILDPSSPAGQAYLEQLNEQLSKLELYSFRWLGEGNDTISGPNGSGSNYINGGGGDDKLFGSKGNDTLQGDHGNDLINGRSGDDWISGGDGDDKLFGNKGDDQIKGGFGKDLINGGLGNDWILGGDGDDVISGGSGADIISGGRGSDIVNLGNGANNKNSSDIVAINSPFEGTDTIKGFNVLDENHDVLNLSELFANFTKAGLTSLDLSAMVKIASNGDLSVTFPSCDETFVLAHLEGLTADDIARLEYDLHDPASKHEIIQLTEELPSFFDPTEFQVFQFPLPGNYVTLTLQPDGNVYGSGL